MTLYRSDIFLSWGGIIDQSVETLIMILLSASLASLFPPYFGEFAVILRSYWTDTCSNNFGTNCGSEGPQI